MDNKRRVVVVLSEMMSEDWFMEGEDGEWNEVMYERLVGY